MHLFNIIIYTLSLITTIYGDGELLILHCPESLHFSSHAQLDSSQLKDVFSASLGYTVEEGSKWPGLEILDPFFFADSVVTFVVPGVRTLNSKLGHTFPLNLNEIIDETYEALLYRTKQRFPERNQTLLKITLEDEPKIDGTVNVLTEDISSSTVPSVMALNYLYLDAEEDIKFIRELKNLRAISEQIIKSGIDRDGTPGIFWITLPNLANVTQFHGIDSDAAGEAKTLLFNEIIAATELFARFYKGRVLVTTVTSEVNENRRVKRQTEPVSVDPNNLNLATDYDVNFPVIFNIIFWFSVAMIFSVLAISISIAGMDPGRDSIIYRMTSTRMKKDN